MISGKLQAIGVSPFTTKSGKDMFKLELTVNNTLYTTISKFEDVKFKVGDNVFFEVQEQYPTSIELGTLKKGAATTHKPVMAPTEEQWAMLSERVKKLEELMKLDDDIPF